MDEARARGGDLRPGRFADPVGIIRAHMGGRYLFTSESVTEGHPDKLADQISDAVLDSILTDDPDGRVACETLLTTGLVLVAGEISTKIYVDVPRVVRETVTGIGYTDAKSGIDGATCGVVVAIQEQSPDIAMGVDKALEARDGAMDPLDELGAGDQGMMIGYACTDTEELMPMPIAVAHRLARRLADVRRAGVLPYLRPDGKSQVTIEYEDGKPVRVHTVVISAQHGEDVDIASLLAPDVREHVIDPVLAEVGLDHDGKRVLVNPTGRFEIGGPKADTGLTGRKIMVDSYGSMAPHGGGCFSGKDPTKVDRSAAYMGRYVAKNVVAAGLADRVQLQVAYAIGTAHPVSLSVETFGTHRVDPSRLGEVIREMFDFRPAAIIRDLDLRRPIYRETAAYGHFGRKGFSWEETDRADDLRRAFD
jgi:S-adenosylmethionine synthetase